MAERITGDEATVAVPSDVASAGSLAGGPSPPLHHRVGGRYEILGLVGSGGMGTVYRARDAELDEVVALKILRRELVDQPGMLERFRQEVKLARRVTHRNVARTYDIGESDGDKFLTMELVDGEALSARIAREGALPPAFVIGVAREICAGLAAAHGAGILHRDLKPDNVLLARDGRVVLTDFGIARALFDSARAVTVGLALGTPAYMAPEQVEGAKDLDARADIYALGAMLFECLTGERPWKGDSVWSVAASRLMQPPPDPRARRPDVPTGAAALVVRCMARQREDRFASAVDAASALDGLTLPVVSRPSPAPPPKGAQDRAADPTTKAVAVLPFRNAGTAADEYIADGLTDDLVDALSMTAGLRVLARGAATRDAGRDPRETGRDLRVDVVVDGSVRRAGPLLRVSARVISVADGFQLWAKRFDAPEKDVLGVSDAAADAIADALTLTRGVPARPSLRDARAVELYLRARQALHVGWRDHVIRAIALLDEALALAPDDPTILSAYASAHLRRFMFVRDDEADAETRIREAASRAIALAPHLGEPRAALASLGWAVGDFRGCARQLREANRISPSSADVNALLGRLLLEAGQPERAVARLRAVLALEPDRNLVAIDVLRGRVLLGDWAALDAALESPPADEVSQMRYMLLLRLVMWRRDYDRASALSAEIESRGLEMPPEVAALLDVVRTRRRDDALVGRITELGTAGGRARRRATFFRQVLVEILAYIGDDAAVEPELVAADSLGLLDLTWLDRCPLLENVRGTRGFGGVRASVAARAHEVVEILDARPE